MPLPDTRGDQAMPAGLADIANEMERTYITNDQWSGNDLASDSVAAFLPVIFDHRRVGGNGALVA